MTNDIKDWSTIPASNGLSDPGINWQEGMPPSAVNNSGRGMMAAVKFWWDALIDGSFWATRNFIVDTNTLVVDTANDRVGIGTALPGQALDVVGAITSDTGIYLGGPSSANLLADYEEGVFTPTLVGLITAGLGTYTIQTGRYVKIGKIVHIEIELEWTDHTGVGDMRVAGLPFNGVPGQTSAMAVRTNDLAFGAGKQIQANVFDVRVIVVAVDPAGGPNVDIPKDTAGGIFISGTYDI